MKSDTLKAAARGLRCALFGLLSGPVLAQTSAAPPLDAAAPTAAAVPVPAPPAAVAPPVVATPALDGIWKGPLKVPGGQLDVLFRLVRLSSGEYFATLDVPQQKVSRLAVRVETKADTVRFIADEANSRFTGRLASDAQQLTGTWQQPGFQTPLTLSYAAAPVPTTKNARLTPPYREEDLAFDNPTARLRLAGQLTVPAGAGPFPAVVLLSDAGAQDRDGTENGFSPLGQLADYLTRRGIAVLRFDDRGVGQSTGKPGSAAPELVSDAQAALTYLRSRPEINPAHLGIVGHGEGGNVALLAASQPQPPAFVVALAAAGLSGTEVVLQQRAATLRAAGTTGAPLEAALKLERAMLDAILLNPDQAMARLLLVNLLRQRNPSLDNAGAQAIATEMTAAHGRLAFNPFPGLAGVECPVLLLHGAADTALDADANLARLSKGLSLNKQVEQKKLPGVNHLFQAPQGQWPVVSGQPRPVLSPLVEETIREWIVARVKK